MGVDRIRQAVTYLLEHAEDAIMFLGMPDAERRALVQSRGFMLSEGEARKLAAVLKRSMASGRPLDESALEGVVGGLAFEGGQTILPGEGQGH